MHTSDSANGVRKGQIAEKVSSAEIDPESFLKIKLAYPKRLGFLPPMNLATQSALYLKKGNEMQQITLSQIPAFMEVVRTREMDAGRGGGQFRGIALFNDSGKRAARIAWNGSVWANNGTEIAA